MRRKSSKCIPLGQEFARADIRSISDKLNRLENDTRNVINIRLKTIQWLNMDTIRYMWMWVNELEIFVFLLSTPNDGNQIHREPNQFLLNVAKRQRNGTQSAWKILCHFRKQKLNDKTSSTIFLSCFVVCIFSLSLGQLMIVAFQMSRADIVCGHTAKMHRLTLKFRYLSIKLAVILATWSACAA